MKKLSLALAILMLWPSCTMVRYENPQPSDVVALPFFPKQMYGSFISDEQDTLEIDSLRFHFRNGEEINVTGDLTSEKIILKQMENYFIINIQDQKDWDVLPVTIEKDKIIVHYTSLSSKVDDFMEELKLISEVKEVADSTGHLHYYLIDPTREQFQTLLRKKLYNEEMIFKRIK